ncbi:MAG: hypothetical protein AB7F89_18025 [Pirellulaceae bacterium]
MFGKPEWFRERASGWGVRPIRWHGWLYGAGWIGAIAAPFVLLVARHQAPEALIWLVASLGLFSWDVAALRRAVRSTPGREVLYIGDDGECGSVSPVHTRK